MTSEIVNQAHGYAACAHRKQQRKYTGEHYIVHPATVAATLQLAGLPDFVVAAAYLHDVIEDCDVTFLELDHQFGLNIATLVYQVTDVFTSAAFPSWNRAQRKEMERKRLSTVHHYAQSIKVADLIDNTHSIVRHDPGFAKLYLAEKKLLLALLTKAEPKLLEQARLQLEGLGEI
jgi:guanosine-3',5'-bis(diphosphate) 3'-pyrophosphohydrolase